MFRQSYRRTPKGVKKREAFRARVQQVDDQGRSAFLELAEGLGLGVAARARIVFSDINMG